MGRPLTYTRVAKDQVVAGGPWICPASTITVTTDLSLSTTNRTYQHDAIKSNYNACYAGLYYHERASPHYLVNGAPASAVTAETWRAKYFAPYAAQVPIQWCSMRGFNGLSGSNYYNALGMHSWHAITPTPGGGGLYGSRPTLFIDGHVAVLENMYYSGDFQHVLSANATPKTVHAYIEPNSNPPAGLGQAARYALSEY
jgi:hypothetical protein